MARTKDDDGGQSIFRRRVTVKLWASKLYSAGGLPLSSSALVVSIRGGIVFNLSSYTIEKNEAPPGLHASIGDKPEGI